MAFLRLSRVLLKAEVPLPVVMFQLNIHYSLKATHLEEMRWAPQRQASLIGINESKLCSFHLLFQLKKTNKPTAFCPGAFLIAKEKTSTISSVEKKL